MANTDQKLVVTELDFGQIKNNLKNFLRDQSEFTDFDFEASGMSTLLDVLAYNTHYMSYYNNMIANEMFLDTAVLRDSVVSHAKMLGYTPRSAVSPRATINLQITRDTGSETTLTLPRFTRFQSTPFNGISYTFVNIETETAEYDPTCDRFCFDDLYIFQGTPLSYTFAYNSTNNPSQSFELPDFGIDTNTLEVLVQDSASSLKTEKYTLATDVAIVNSNSAVYFLEESRNGKYKIFFGNGVVGKSLTNGNLVIATYVKTDGAAANKANAFTLVDSVGGYTNSIIFPLVAASGGDDQEPISRIRFTAPKAYVSNGRGVTTDDLIALINKNYPYFQSVNVWGGEENDPPIYGKVFVSAKPTEGFEITESEKLFVIENIIKPVSVVTVIPEFVDADYNFININASVYYDSTKTNKSKENIRATIRNAIIGYKATDLDNFNSRFKLSRLLRRIDDSDISISDSNAAVTIQKRIVPVFNATRNYTLNYGTPLSREDSKYKISSAPGYIDRDSNLVERTCFLEETPGSSSGVEKIAVLAAPNSYERTPTIRIFGDGIGATARPIIVNGKVTSIIVDNPGVDYTSAIAYLYYDGEIDTTARFSVSVQGRFGILRSFFYDENNIKTILNPNAGTIDYSLGVVKLVEFSPLRLDDSSNVLKITAKPATNNFESARNRIITIDPEDPVAINIEVNSVE